MRTPPRVLLAGPLAVLLAAAAIGADDVIPHRQDRAPNRPYSPQEAIERMKVPEGFSVELVASEPDIVNPLAMTFDERGRIWITESLEYPRKSAGPGRDRIQVLEDTDRDGRADRFTVFAEGFNIPSGVAVGHGGVWVVNAPDLLFLREEGGRETGREVVVSGFGRTDTHELPNSLTWGPDGWLYGLNGVFNRSHVVSGESEHRFTCALWRVHPKTREFQIVCEGTSNPWGLVWAADGSAIVSACHWANDHIFHFVETGTYQRQAGPYPPYTLKIGSVSDHSHQKTAYCGLAYFDSDAYPLPYRDRLYLGNVHGNCINVDVLGRDGSTYVSRSQPDLLTADDVWFMPVSQKVGPDGCLYILDWYDRYHCYQDANRDPEGVDRLRGRLYRVRYRDTPRAPRFDLARESDERLVERLASPNIYFRETAQRLLVERSHPALRRRLEQLVLDDAAPPKARRHALWSLVGAGPLRTDFHLRLLEHPDDVFRAWGVRAAGNRGEVSGKIARKVAALARDPVPEVQLQVAIASRKVAGLDALEVLSDVLDGAGHDKLIPSIAWPNLHPLLDDEGERFVRRIERQRTPLPPALATLVPHALSRLLAEPRPDARAARRLLEFLCRQDAALAKRCLAAVSAAITGRSAESLAAIRGEVAPLVERLRSDPEGPLFLGAQLLAARLALGTADAGSVRRRFLSSAAPEDERLEALETLVAFRDPALLEAVGRVLVSGPPGFLGRVLGALGSWDEPKLADVVLRRYPEMAPELQPLAVDLLMQRLRWMRKLVDAVRDGRLPRSTLDANHLRRILESNDRHAIWAVEGTWGRVRRVRDPDRERVVREMAELLRRTPGEPLAGEKVFRRLCAQCHAIHDEGQDVGPDLTTNGRASFDQLVSNVFDPSLVIGPGYEVTTVVTRSGRVLTGLVAEDSAARMVLKTPGGKRETVSRNRVKYTSVSQLSMMPEGIEKLVEPGDLVDLFAFLSSDRHPRDPRARPIPGAPRASSVASGAPDGGTGGAPGGGHREDATAKTSAGPFLATGVRVGEVGPRRAIVWVRLTARPERHASGKKAAEAAGKKHVELAEGVRVSELEGSCPGAPGSARVLYSERRDLEDGRETPWRAARQDADFVVQLPLAGLSPGTTVHYRVESRSPAGDSGASFTGSFRTAEVEDSEAPVSFTVVTGMMYRDLDDERGFHIYDAMRRLEPSFLVATGDTVYYDSEWPRARGAELARYHWHRMYSLPRIVEFHRRVPGYWLKDDHDTLDDDCWPGKKSGAMSPLTFERGQALFREQVPMGKSTYRTARWGRHLQVWFVEGRDFRSSNRQEDGPGKTIWGAEQKAWLKRTLTGSDATFKVLVSATPIVGPDRPRGKNDNHSNAAFRTEGEGFRRWARENLHGRFYVVCGDRHWQYHSVDPVTGVQEFSCGPASDKHAGGSPGLDPRYHRFHRVKGGFLSVSADAGRGRPRITFRFHDVHGEVVHEVREEAIRGEELQPPPRESGRWGPVHDRLLAEARTHLRERAERVARLTDPVAIRERRETIRRTILESFGGFPERTPLEARVAERVERADHFLDKVIFESRPGFHVTANLYLPKRGKPPYPTILLPCGHSKNGKAGSTYQTAGQEFARRGFAVLIYDPIGQGERFQYLDDGGKPIIGGTTEHMVTGTAALLVGSNTAEVIIWDGIRAIDYLATRREIDLERLGCSGNSGGGTQTSYLMALEPRIRAAAPSCYLTTFERLLSTIGVQDAEQNFTGFIKEGLDHADFVLAFAPRPALICAASDDFFDIGGTWTTFREAKRIYGRLGRPDDVDLVEVDGRHGYHLAIRQRVGRFFEAHLMGRPPAAITPTVPAGTVYPDEALQATETGQVISSLGGRSVADLWRDRERKLRPARDRRFRDTPRAGWLEGVRRLAGMAKEVSAPTVEVTRLLETSGAVVERHSWDAGYPVDALLFRPGDGHPGDGHPGGRRPSDQQISRVEVVALEGGPEPHAARWIGRAGRGETILAIRLPGFEADDGRGDRWGPDWKIATLSHHLGRSLAGIRADAVRQAIAHVRRLAGGDHPGAGPGAGPGTGGVRLTGVGRACVPALLAAALEPRVAALRLERGLDSWASIVEKGLHNGRLGNVVPGALRHFDLPLLREAMAPRPVEVVRPTGPDGRALEVWGF